MANKLVFHAECNDTTLSFAECADFVTRCPQNNMFKKKQLSVHTLEGTQQVLIEDVKGLNEDYLCLYVEKAGVEVEKILFSEDDQSAILTLKDHKGKGLFCEFANSVTINRQDSAKSFLFMLQCKK